jgi:hypothetical protein
MRTSRKKERKNHARRETPTLRITFTTRSIPNFELERTREGIKKLRRRGEREGDLG